MKRVLAITFSILLPMSAFADFMIEEEDVNSTVNEVLGEREYTFSEYGDLPTPYTLGKGNFTVEFAMYGGGGVYFKASVGLSDFFSIGVSDNIDGLIGSGEVSWNVPGAFLKLKMFDDLLNTGLLGAIGFDSFAYGKYGIYEKAKRGYQTIYGVFLTFDKPYVAGSSEGDFVFGYRYPVLPTEYSSPQNSSMFFSISLIMAKHLYTAIGLENLVFDVKRTKESVLFLDISPRISKEFGLSVLFQYSFQDRIPTRILKFEYTSSF